MYRRTQSAWSPLKYDYNTSTKTKVMIHWSPLSSAYSVKFMDMKHYNLIQPILSYMKSKPYGEYLYDPDNKIWFLIEKHVPGLRAMLDVLKEYFEIDFIEKQEGHSFNQSQEIPTEVWIKKFKQLTGLDNIEKKNYLRWMLKNHPDVGGDSRIVSEVNECWSNINKKEIEYANS